MAAMGKNTDFIRSDGSVFSSDALYLTALLERWATQSKCPLASSVFNRATIYL